MFSYSRSPLHDIRSSYYYKDIGAVRSPHELHKALRFFGAKVTEAESRKIFKNFPDNIGGFNFRRFTERVVLEDGDRRKERNLNRIDVIDPRRNGVYAIRSLPPQVEQTQKQQSEAAMARQRARALSRTIHDHPFAASMDSVRAGEIDSKMTLPHSISNARPFEHEASQLYPRLDIGLRVHTHVDPFGTFQMMN
jgi:hypothetical protein